MRVTASGSQVAGSGRGIGTVARTGVYVVSGVAADGGAAFLLPPEANNATVTISYWATTLSTTPQFQTPYLRLLGRNAPSGTWTRVSSVTRPALTKDVWTHVSYTVVTAGEYAEFAVSGNAGAPSNQVAMDDWAITYELTTSTYARDAGVWKPSLKYSRDAGVWKPALTSVRDGNTWKGV